ncbi:anti-sigma factor antagonist [Phormidesmis priestleyi ULC007]|uniref:Anti-sigma factor antagonist n=1 Tax=Phormidesmis priestleyi ULC007 TaxID=1920490 RepID=A0A2T1DNY4_9CYAN|nr:STAS domain-containing protein [Phormidesmis priestleyi]PSB22213.1 anti-sigma factor antagonist [Phormidesmis priestleyi ULC007]PZO52526.1 MAG: anti-sigma factor antagonist [Phormidesmis priestleyi]
MQSVLIRRQTIVICPKGFVNAANASALQNQLAIAVESTHNSDLLIDMRDVESLDSAGLMVLVSTLSLAQKQNKRFSVCSVSASIRIIFELTQLDRVFEIFENSAAFEATA